MPKIIVYDDSKASVDWLAANAAGIAAGGYQLVDWTDPIAQGQYRAAGLPYIRASRLPVFVVTLPATDRERALNYALWAAPRTLADLEQAAQGVRRERKSEADVRGFLEDLRAEPEARKFMRDLMLIDYAIRTYGKDATIRDLWKEIKPNVSPELVAFVEGRAIARDITVK